MLAVFAGFEREILRERVKAGIAQARSNGMTFGRPKSAAKKICTESLPYPMGSDPALWKAFKSMPVQQLASFIGGLLAAVGIAWLVAWGHVVPLKMRFGAVGAAGVAIGLLWRGRR